MLNHNSFASQSPITLFLSCGQRMGFGFLERCLTVFVKVSQSLIASICQNAKLFGKLTTIVFEHLKVMLASVTKRCGKDLSALSIRNHLRFLGMLLLFATVMPFLTFFGRSIGCSLTSTNITSNMVLLAWSAFLPGSRNLFERLKTFSTFWTVRQTVASLTPYD